VNEEAKDVALVKKEKVAANEKAAANENTTVVVVVKKEKIEDNPFDLNKATSFLNDPTS
jgi:hypothetical protein